MYIYILLMSQAKIDYIINNRASQLILLLSNK